MLGSAVRRTDVPDGDAGSADVTATRRGLWVGLDQASIMGVELIAAILTWAGIGYLADRALGTSPVLLAVGALVGNAAGLYLIWLRSGRMDAASAARDVSGEQEVARVP